MKYLKLLLELKEELCYGIALEYKGTVTNIVEADYILSAKNEISRKRTKYLQETENPLNEKDWLDTFKGTPTYIGYMLDNGFKLNPDYSFILDINLDQLETLAEIFLKYKLK